jgi:hypothetical protein
VSPLFEYADPMPASMGATIGKPTPAIIGAEGMGFMPQAK